MNIVGVGEGENEKKNLIDGQSKTENSPSVEGNEE